MNFSSSDAPWIPLVPSGSYPVRAGNSVRPLIDGEPAFRRICEAIEAAETSVWATVTFMWPEFRMPDGRGTALDVLERAAARGVDVRLLFWRPDEETARWRRNAFWGSEAHLVELTERRSRIRVRWDRAHPGFCQHQKSWLIDAAGDGATGFVGGINLNPNSMVAPGHFGEGQNHDVYVEIAGPATADVQHNFTQRWNEASERNIAKGHWGEGSEADLPFPRGVPAERGEAMVQIQRTIHPGRYTDGRRPPGGWKHEIAQGERSILEQYLAALNAAHRTIYIENQYVTVPEILEGLHGALEREVEVLLLVPAEPDGFVRYIGEGSDSFLKMWDGLASFENFTLAGIAGLNAGGQRTPVYVHGKLMLVDDIWATVGSANLHRASLFGNGEMNASFYCSQTVGAFRAELFREHLGTDTSHLDDISALRFFRQVATANRARWDAGDPNWQGLAFALDVTSYGR